jgi:hypothetical protein
METLPSIIILWQSASLKIVTKTNLPKMLKSVSILIHFFFFGPSGNIWGHFSKTLALLHSYKRKIEILKEILRKHELSQSAGCSASVVQGSASVVQPKRPKKGLHFNFIAIYQAVTRKSARVQLKKYQLTKSPFRAF